MMLLSNIADGLVIGSTYVLIALGVTLIFGIVDVVQIAHGEVYMIGAFVTLFLVNSLHLNYFISIVISMAILAIFGMILEEGVFRWVRGRPHLPVILAAFGLSMVLANSTRLLLSGESYAIKSPLRNEMVHLGFYLINAQRLLVVVVGTGLTVCLFLFINKTRLGMAMRAIAQDRDAADLVGISANKIFMAAFAVASALAAAAGALVGPIFVVNPAMGFMPFLKSFVVVLFGGVGSVMGSIVGGLTLGVMETLGAAYVSTQYKDAVAFALLIVVLLFKPTGLFGRKTYS
jgi:branched-chain amino acid transport system permease protein